MSEKRLHNFKYQVSFGDIDQAKRIYFARIFDIAHKCLESFASEKGLYEQWFQKMEWATPIRHTEAEFFKPITVGDPLEVHLYPDELGKTSLSWRFIFLKNNEIVASVKTTHVSLDLKTGEKKSVPDELAKLFN